MTSSAAGIETLLISVPAVARAINVSPATAWRRVTDGTIKSVMIGARRMVPVEEVRRIAAEGLPLKAASSTDDRPAA